jgi:uncharacterized protein YdhG (YjbR/CyaY superfamily)
MEKVDYKNIDEYILSFPPETQKLLEQVRSVIKNVAAEAQETISYGMPTFVYKGVLVHFAAFKNHLGLYALPSANEAFKEDLSKYKTGKGSIQFPLNEPIPHELIRRIVKFRIEENIAKSKNKKTKAK